MLTTLIFVNLERPFRRKYQPPYTLLYNVILNTCGATRNPEFPRTGPDRNRSGVGEHFKEYFWIGSGRGILFRGRSGSGILFRAGPGRGIFTGVWDISPGISGINLPFTEEVEWLLSLKSTLFDIITSFICVYYNFIHVFIVVWNFGIFGSVRVETC